MGTRADFYVGKGRNAKWLGSIGWDGYRDGISGYILKAKTEANYRKAVRVFLSARGDATFPKDGWPWPWNTSATSDCSYWFFEGHCWDANYRTDSLDEQVFVRCDIKPNEDDGEFLPDILAAAETIDFPDMSARKAVTFGARSGLIVIRAKSPEQSHE
jgi:hypothetical protein